MDIDEARTYVTYAYALVIISVVIDFALRVIVRSDRLHNRFLKGMDKYGWLVYLMALCTVNDTILPVIDYRVYMLIGISIFSLCVSWYRYKEIIPKVRAQARRTAGEGEDAEVWDD